MSSGEFSAKTLARNRHKVRYLKSLCTEYKRQEKELHRELAKVERKLCRTNDLIDDLCEIVVFIKGVPVSEQRWNKKAMTVRVYSPASDVERLVKIWPNVNSKGCYGAETFEGTCGSSILKGTNFTNYAVLLNAAHWYVATGDASKFDKLERKA